MIIDNVTCPGCYYQSITHLLYHLIADPSLVKVLREEIEPIIAVEGWTKAAIDKMWNTDSIFKESQRLNGINIRTLYRMLFLTRS